MMTQDEVVEKQPWALGFGQSAEYDSFWRGLAPAILIHSMFCRVQTYFYDSL